MSASQIQRSPLSGAEYEDRRVATRFQISQNVPRHEIVSLIDGEAVTTTLAIAIGCNVDHASVIKLVRTYQADLEEFGLLRFEIQPRPIGQHGGADTEFAILNEQQSTLIMTYMRNSPVVREFKKTLVKEFWLLVRGKPVVLPSYAETLRLYADQIEQTQRVTHERDHAIATKAEIGSRREATAMATAANAKREAAKLRDDLGFSARHATVMKVEAATKRTLGYVDLRRWCKANDVRPEIVPDKRYADGVKAWPAAAWMAVFGIDIADLFGTDGESNE